MGTHKDSQQVLKSIVQPERTNLLRSLLASLSDQELFRIHFHIVSVRGTINADILSPLPTEIIEKVLLRFIRLDSPLDVHESLRWLGRVGGVCKRWRQMISAMDRIYLPIATRLGTTLSLMSAPPSNWRHEALRLFQKDIRWRERKFDVTQIDAGTRKTKDAPPMVRLNGNRLVCVTNDWFEIHDLGQVQRDKMENAGHTKGLSPRLYASGSLPATPLCIDVDGIILALGDVFRNILVFNMPESEIASSPTRMEPVRMVKTGYAYMFTFLAVRGSLVFSVGYTSRIINVWNWDTNVPRKPLTGHYHPITALARSGDTLASGSVRGSLRLWSLSSLSCIAVIDGILSAPIRSLAFPCTPEIYRAPDLLVVFSGDWEVVNSECTIGCIHWRDFVEQKTTPRYVLEKPSAPVNRVFTDGRFIAALHTFRKSLQVWGIRDREASGNGMPLLEQVWQVRNCVGEWSDRESTLHGIDFAMDNDRFVLSLHDGRILLLN
ncbi:WD40-repeat-containing domain protein [Cladochytrium replicatum]|nr:WD40-repeat-containing domain protein [Cladochytrium replicatum]